MSTPTNTGAAARARAQANAVTGAPTRANVSTGAPTHTDAPIGAPEHDDKAAGAVFAALSDPTRRHVVHLLREQPTVTASALTAELAMTRQAITKHLTALAEAGLVRSERRGRETHYALTPAPMTHAISWMAEAGGRWDRRLDRLEREAAALRDA